MKKKADVKQAWPTLRVSGYKFAHRNYENGTVMLKNPKGKVEVWYESPSRDLAAQCVKQHGSSVIRMGQLFLVSNMKKAPQSRQRQASVEEYQEQQIALLRSIHAKLEELIALFAEV